MTTSLCSPPHWTPACTAWQQARLRADACEFFGVIPEELDAKVRDGQGTASVWNYIHWAAWEWEYGWPQAVANGLRDFGCEKVLDFGSGVGEISLHLTAWNDAEVTMCDLPGPWAEFAAWRVKRREYLQTRGPVPPSVLRIGDWNADALLCLEVMEHLEYAPMILTYLLGHTRRALCISGAQGRPETDDDPLHVFHASLLPTIAQCGFVLVRGGGMPWWFLREEVARAEGVVVLEADGTTMLDKERGHGGEV
jgi:hypothetical protein